MGRSAKNPALTICIRVCTNVRVALLQEELHTNLLRWRLYHLRHDYQEAAEAKAEYDAELEEMRAVRPRLRPAAAAAAGHMSGQIHAATPCIQLNYQQVCA